MSAVRNYALVTAAYWSFTLTDGALRMLVLLHFHDLGYTPVQLAFLFLFYEFFGIVTNLFGGWIAARMGLRVTLLSGLLIQVFALLMLSLLDPTWGRLASVGYVMAAQALSGIAKDLTKMSSKSAIKTLVPADQHSSLFKWVALLTGSKNALKGVGFFLGGALLTIIGFRGALWAMAGALAIILLGSALSLPADMGKAKNKSKLGQLLSKSRGVNVLSAARFFLFGARDVWFVVGVPVFLDSQLGWSFTATGTALAAWVVGYGVVQSSAPMLIKRATHGRAPQGGSAQLLAFILAAVMALVAIGLVAGVRPTWTVLGGLGLFGVVFALNSAVHSYLILAYSDGDKVALNVGFYYMANAGGRLLGSLLSGVLYQAAGLRACLWASAAMAGAAGMIAVMLPPVEAAISMDDVADVGGGE
jgi:predicted MFS family arabinose efflux permease